MKTGKSLVELAKELQRQEETKKDFIASTEQLTMKAETTQPEPVDLDGIIQETQERTERARAAKSLGKPTLALDIEGQGQFDIRDTAHDQISTWTGIPRAYYRRMQENYPELLAKNVNQWMQHEPKPRLIRTLDGHARAFLSNRYRRIDHTEVLQSILPVLGEIGLSSSDIVSCEVTDRKLYLKALFPKVQGEVTKGDVVQSGIVISNSEIGQGAVSAQPLIYRLVCLNGMIRADFGLRKMHVGRIAGEGRQAYEFFKDDTLRADDEAFLKKLRDVTRAAGSEATFARMIEDLRETTQRKVDNPVKAVEVLTKKFNLTETTNNRVLNHFIEGGDLSQYGLAQAVTRHSQDVESYDEATDLERIGGQIIELPRTDWETIKSAA